MSEISLCPQNSLQNQFTSAAKLKPDFQFLVSSTDLFYIRLLLCRFSCPFCTYPFLKPVLSSQVVLAHQFHHITSPCYTSVHPPWWWSATCLAPTCWLPSLILIFNNNSNFTSLLFYLEETYKTLFLRLDFDCHLKAMERSEFPMSKSSFQICLFVQEKRSSGMSSSHKASSFLRFQGMFSVVHTRRQQSVTVAEQGRWSLSHLLTTWA